MEWQFSKTDEPGSFKRLAFLTPARETVLNDTFSGISVVRPATLVLQNVTINHNGTYRISIRVFPPSDTNPQTSDILVIVLGKKLVTLCGGFSSNRTTFIFSNYFFQLTPDQGCANDGLILLG